MIVFMNNIVNETRRLARKSVMTVSEICSAATVKRRWYHKFVAGEFKDPGISKVLRLNRALKRSAKKAA